MEKNVFFGRDFPCASHRVLVIRHGSKGEPQVDFVFLFSFRVTVLLPIPRLPSSDIPSRPFMQNDPCVVTLTVGKHWNSSPAPFHHNWLINEHPKTMYVVQMHRVFNSLFPLFRTLAP